MKQRGGELFVLLALLGLLAFAGVQLLRPPQNAKEERPHRTTYSAKPTGWKAFYMLLKEKERGYNVTRLQNAIPYYLEHTNPQVLIVGPEYEAGFLQDNDWTEKEAKATRKWVENGGTLCLISGKKTALTKALGLNVIQRDAPEEKTKDEKNALHPPTQPAPYFAGVRLLDIPNFSTLLSSTDALPLVTYRQKTLAATRTLGKGRVLWIGNGGMADNGHIGQADNARFLDQYLRTVAPKNATIAFDEFHQGKQDAESLWTYLGKSGQGMVWQLVLVILIAGYSAALRFGLPRPLPRTSRVSGEYVSSVADLYRRAGATDLVLGTLYQRFWQDLCRTVDRETDANVTEVIRRAARLTARDKDQVTLYEERLGRLITACKAQPEKPIKEAEMLQWVQEIESLRMALQLEQKIS
jgi:hypothetical protein